MSEGSGGFYGARITADLCRRGLSLAFFPSSTPLWSVPLLGSRSSFQEQTLHTRLQHLALGMRPKKLAVRGPSTPVHDLEGPAYISTKKLHATAVVDAHRRPCMQLRSNRNSEAMAACWLPCWQVSIEALRSLCLMVRHCMMCTTICLKFSGALQGLLAHGCSTPAVQVSSDRKAIHHA